MSARLLIPAALLLCGVVSHPAAAAGSRPKLVSCTYQVADLVIPVNDAGQGGTTEEALIKQITSTIKPRSWSERGGVGTIDYYPMTRALVVNQTSDVQDQIADLLAALRRLQDVEVQMEVRLVSVPAATFQRLAEEGKLNLILDNSHLVELLETIQTDPGASVMQMPRLTTRSGQHAGFVICGNQASRTNGTQNNGSKAEKVRNELRVSVEPTVSADRRTVAVTFGIWKSELRPTPGNPPGVQQTMPTINTVLSKQDIPDGHTAVMQGWTQQRHGVVMASSIEYGLPILSAIPYVNRLFRTVSYTPLSDQVLILVTPRIVVAQEKEERKISSCPCPRATSAPCTTSDTNQGVVRCGLKEQANADSPAANMVRQYHAACRDGNLPMAKAIAEQALWLDPACFSKGCGCAKQP